LIFSSPPPEPEVRWVETHRTDAVGRGEAQVSNWVAQLDRGETAETNYTNIVMTRSIHGELTGTYYNAATNSGVVYIAQDLDGDGYIDHVWQRDDDQSPWRVATHTGENGKPVWLVTTETPDEKRRRDEEERKKREEQEG
jgi:hypothetical protein